MEVRLFPAVHGHIADSVRDHLLALAAVAVKSACRNYLRSGLVLDGHVGHYRFFGRARSDCGLVRGSGQVTVCRRPLDQGLSARGLRVRCSGIRSVLSVPISATLYATLPIPVPHGVRLCRPVPRHTSKQRANTPGDDLGPFMPEPRSAASAEDHRWRPAPPAWAPRGQAAGLLCTGGVPCIDLRCTRAADDAQRHASG
jgi:hypothetical protein